MTEAKILGRHAIEALGQGFDITNDFRLKYCKRQYQSGSSLVELDEKNVQDIVLPGGLLIPNVSRDIRCDKGEQTRFKSDILEFNQMSELLNQKASISGRIPSGHFNSMYAFTGAWLTDATETKHLAFDGYFISLYSVHLTRSPLVLKEEVKKAVPTFWDPAALARFINTYGTHIIVDVTVGGQDVVFVRQSHSSTLSPTELKRHLDNIGDQLFTGTCSLAPLHAKNRESRQRVPKAFSDIFQPNTLNMDSFSAASSKDGITVICSKRGGLVSLQSHCEWLLTVPTNPEAILFKFIPITSLLAGVPGSGFLSQAINLYLRYKPRIGDLRYFLEFQVHLEWAPMHSELPLGISSKRLPCLSLQFSLMSPKLYVNMAQVSVGRNLVSGLRLYLEGKKCDRLAIHLQYLSTLPKILQPLWYETIFSEAPRWRGSDERDNQFFEPVQKKNYSHICTVAIKHDPNWVKKVGRGVFVVTGAQLQVKGTGSKNVLHLNLQFTRLPNCTIEKSMWDHAPAVSQRSRFLTTLSTTFSTSQQPSKPVPVVLNSAHFPNGPPVPVQSPKLLKFVDTSEICKGPNDIPGHWLLTAARLDINNGKISLQGKFSLLNYRSPVFEDC
ncbi:hypothetical protein SUGI_0180610 [Cryptomeria japonica]|uniref:MACPF domain-containing protein At4g24290 n=1 Tax=Cryptomeria japonica TaxID=3369 RepID=UPI002408EAE5|nr:MACPF domain-containing protein At4g24290 [Cryptomeria japonica]GLJ11938.1 hypothetical protein SUGI_0180610 [Cryptomeria japonica]